MDEYGLKTRPSSPVPEVLVAGEETAGWCGLAQTVEEPGAKQVGQGRWQQDARVVPAVVSHASSFGLVPLGTFYAIHPAS